MALFKRKDKENKKGSENAIGKIIYGFLLFMPLLSIGARCLYVIFNKNAYQSYSANINNKYETNNVTNNNDLVYGNIYNFTLNSQPTTWNTVYQQFYCSAIYNVPRFNEVFNCDGTTENGRIVFRGNNNNVWISNADNTNDTLFNLDLTTATYPLTFQIVFEGLPSETRIDYTYFSESTWNVVDYTTNATLDNVFEYSINQTQQSNIYNWAKETGTYTVLHNTTTGLGITNELIPMLMAYWLIVSVIYFLFDIALILIWAVHKKIHELQESI